MATKPPTSDICHTLVFPTPIPWWCPPQLCLVHPIKQFDQFDRSAINPGEFTWWNHRNFAGCLPPAHPQSQRPAAKVMTCSLRFTDSHHDFICNYTYIYIYTCMCIYVNICIYIYACVCIYIYMHVYVHIYA